jgi:hypothetical protein
MATRVIHQMMINNYPIHIFKQKQQWHPHNTSPTSSEQEQYYLVITTYKSSF